MVERLNELELRYTEQQALLQALSEVVYGQQKQIDALGHELQRLKQKLEAIDELPTIGPAERPPHY